MFPSHPPAASVEAAAGKPRPDLMDSVTGAAP